MIVSLSEIRKAQQGISGRLTRTPLLDYGSFGFPFRPWFKLELLQRTGSFKVRGALYRMSALSRSARRRGVITISSGNHAQAVAYAARLSEIPATIVMPDWSDASKVAATRGYGARVILTREALIPTCRKLEQEEGLELIHPFDDPRIIAGAATVGMEIVEDLPAPDIVMVAVGGGGLISGVAAAIRQTCPQARILGVEPEGAAVMTRSLEQGSPATLDQVETVADGLAAPFAGRHTLEHVQQLVERIVTVSDGEILAAMRYLFEQCKVVCEPAGAAAFAPLLHQQFVPPPGATVVTILCGGNISAERFKSLI